jgi:hypothetical protein
LGVTLGVRGTAALGQLQTAQQASVTGLQPLTCNPTGATNPIQVRVAENAPPTVLDLSGALGKMPGIQHKRGLRLRLLGNTNSGLVQTDLCETVLTLTYSRGKSGAATITVAATDAHGVSVKMTVQVTVAALKATPPRAT